MYGENLKLNDGNLFITITERNSGSILSP